MDNRREWNMGSPRVRVRRCLVCAHASIVYFFFYFISFFSEKKPMLFLLFFPFHFFDILHCRTILVGLRILLTNLFREFNIVKNCKKLKLSHFRNEVEMKRKIILKCTGGWIVILILKTKKLFLGRYF